MLLVAVIASAQIKLKATASGLPGSLVTYSHKITAEGSKTISLTMEFSGREGRIVRVRTERTYAKDGSPVRVFQETVSQKPAFRNSVTVTFDEQGARAVSDERGKRTVKDIPLVSTAPRKCISEFWFLRDKPKVGQTEKYYHFDAAKLEWRISEATYVGPTKVKIGKVEFAGHLVRSPDGEAVLDDKGLPIRLDYGAVTMVRISAG
jgi:hypothetical protein